MKRRYWAMLACISAIFGQAQAAAPDPANANAGIPATTYRSPFAENRPLGEDKNTAWKDANDTVGKVGGWRAYAREAADAMKMRSAGEIDKAKPAVLSPPPVDSPQPGSKAPPRAPSAPAVQPHKHGG